MAPLEQIVKPSAGLAPPRLLHVTTVAPTLRAFLLPYACYFRGLGWRVDALTGRHPAPDAAVHANHDAVYTVDWTRSPWRALWAGPACCRQIADLVRRNQYDIVHVHTPIASFLTRLALRKLRATGHVRVVYTAHGFHFHPLGNWLLNQLYAHLERLAGQWTDALIVINRHDQDLARQHCIVADAKIHHCPGIGIDLAYWQRETVRDPEMDALRHQWHISIEAPVLLCVADLIPRKRHADLLRAFAALWAARSSMTGSDWPVLILAGDGPCRHRLEQLAHRLGVTAALRLVGFQEDLRPYYKMAAATVLVSTQEGLPRSVMESLAMETPVVATAVRGCLDLVNDSCGVLVPPHDVQALCRALQKILAMPCEVRRAWGQRGRSRLTAYSIQHCLAHTEQVYTALLQAG
jgi:glycosyltransferase involved in cell wall biosynthesis